MKKIQVYGAYALVYLATLAATAGAASPMAEGRFGKGLLVAPDGTGWAEAPYRVEYGKLPITFECWVKVNETAEDGVIASFGSTAQSGHHWAIICHAGLGDIGLHVSGLTPETFRGRVAIGDGKWHYIAMLLEERRARIFVDGVEAINNTAEPSRKWKQAGPLCFGGYYHLKLTDRVGDAAWRKRKAVFLADDCCMEQRTGEHRYVDYRPHPHRLSILFSPAPPVSGQTGLAALLGAGAGYGHGRRAHRRAS